MKAPPKELYKYSQRAATVIHEAKAKAKASNLGMVSFVKSADSLILRRVVSFCQLSRIILDV